MLKCIEINSIISKNIKVYRFSEKFHVPKSVLSYLLMFMAFVILN